MGETGPSLELLSGLLCAIGYGLLALQLLRSRYAGATATPAQRLLLAAVTTSAAWGAAVAIAEWSAYTGPTFGASLLDVLRYAAWLFAVMALSRGGVSRGPGESGGPAAVAAAAEATPDGARWLAGALIGAALVGLAWRYQTGDHDHDLSRWPLLPLLALPVLGLVLLEQFFRNLLPDSRWAAKPLSLGLMGLFAYDVYLFAEGALLGRVDADARAVRPLVHAVVVPFLVVAVRRDVDWPRRLQVSRRAAFYSAALLLAGAYLLFIAAVGYYVRYFGGEWGRALQLGLAFLAGIALVVFALSASIRARVRVFIGKHFFSYRYDYREEWLSFTATLASNIAPQQMGETVVRALANIVECPSGSLWTRSATDPAYRQTAAWNTAAAAETVPAGDSLPAYLLQRAWLVDLNEYRRNPEAYEGLELPGWLVASDRFWAIIPLPAGSDLLGWVVLGQPRTPVDLDWETRDLVKTASRQAAGYLAQMIATEALLESRKFDAFNRMSAFVVHDLKNIVTQLSLMLKNAQRHHDNPEFQQDMLLTVESSLDKMRRLMLQLREGATPAEGSRGVELQPIVQRISKSVDAAGRRLEVTMDGALATRGHEERLERVLGHLVQNALDATPPEGRVWLKVERFSGQIRVEVGDSGRGMSEDFVRSKLFRPFSSTKGSGMGIGSYESAQYIRELGGSIEVDSEPGRGTVMRVLLPLLDVQRESDLRPREST